MNLKCNFFSKDIMNFIYFIDSMQVSFGPNLKQIERQYFYTFTLFFMFYRYHYTCIVNEWKYFLRVLILMFTMAFTALESMDYSQLSEILVGCSC